ncbi:hypothetical protein SSS_02651 [Sarcoptes scabiei]|uniref:EF-hand domain-containing protein n=2 Tax=Sarcoptes scabiei TaxID=52283 RepID=A0A834VH07_SARSC|nr:hypothetical protein SSS_02651 [Sarcoptes scabiei]
MPPTTKIKSSSSIESVGIGRTPFKADLDVVRLRPEDGIPEHIKIYDCIAYLMICFQHNKIAVNNIENGKVIWLPFVSMQQEGITWQQAAREGVVKLIGKRDAELEAKLAKIPKFEANPLHFMRIEMPENKFYIRYSFFVNIEKSNERPCCEDNELINWIAFSEIPQLDNIWGPELKEFAKMLFHAEFKIQELNLEDQIRILSDKTWGAFLVAQKISQTKLIALYEEFIEHCYPSIYMCQESLKSFLIHFGYSKLDNRYPAIFNSFDFKRRGFIDFNEFVLGLVCMEPTIDNDHPFRIQMLFRFYNTDNTGELSFKDLQSLIRDLNLNEIDPKRISVLADEIWKKIRDKDRLSLEAFEKAIQKRIIKGTEKLLISSKPILQLVMEKNKIKHHHQDRSSKSIRKPKSKLSPTAREKGVCNSCRPQNYQICLHCVCFDSDGRCVKPLRLFDGNLSKFLNRTLIANDRLIDL